MLKGVCIRGDGLLFFCLYSTASTESYTYVLTLPLPDCRPSVVVVAIDELQGKAVKLRLPRLAVGMGIYLPMALTLLIPVGAVIGHVYNRWALRQEIGSAHV